MAVCPLTACIWCLQGTLASKKKKKAKLARVVSTLKRRARQGKAQQQHSFAALQLIHDPQVAGADILLEGPDNPALDVM